MLELAFRNPLDSAAGKFGGYETLFVVMALVQVARVRMWKRVKFSLIITQGYLCTNEDFVQ